MRFQVEWAVRFLLAAVIAGCASDDSLVQKAKPDAAAEVADVAVEAPDSAPAEVAAAPDAKPEVQDVAAACPGGAGCACKADADCPGSACVPTETGKKCAGPCNDKGTCAAGYGCKTVNTAAGAAVKACVQRFARLCEPCVDSNACKTLTEPNSHCVAVAGDKGAKGFYCASGCDSELDCPPGNACKDAVSAEGSGAGKHCVPSGGECGCSALAINDSATTVCFVGAKKADGTLIGICKGQRACSKNGLTDCSAATPKAEFCNGGDDNCDGSTDEGTLCEDSNVCTTDKCLGPGGCENVPTTAQCNDNEACTFDTCDPKAGCKHSNSTAPCDDGSACTKNDVCLGGLCTGSKVDCNDGNPCTDEVCKPATGCLVVNNSDPCDDASQCTKGEKCAEGKCGGGNAVTCDDGNPCTTDGCVPAKGCTATSAEGAPCNDGNACTLSDACTASTCKGATGSCDDNEACTLDSCDKASGCAHLPAPATACDDGNICTVGDLCGGGVCMPGAATSCDDGVYCTKDSCDPKATGKTGCVNSNLPANTPCSDGSVCTLGDVCSAGQCTGTPIVCDDKNPCTQDFCDKAKGCDSKVLTGTPCSLDCKASAQCNSGVCIGSGAAPDGTACANGTKTCSGGACGP